MFTLFYRQVCIYVCILFIQLTRNSQPDSKENKTELAPPSPVLLRPPPHRLCKFSLLLLTTGEQFRQSFVYGLLRTAIYNFPEVILTSQYLNVRINAWLLEDCWSYLLYYMISSSVIYREYK